MCCSPGSKAALPHPKRFQPTGAVRPAALAAQQPRRALEDALADARAIAYPAG